MESLPESTEPIGQDMVVARAPIRTNGPLQNALTATIPDWNNQPVSIARSGGGVTAVTDPFRNLVQTGVKPWPPSEIIQKLYRSRQERAFSDEQLVAVQQGLGFYCDLQSLHSEDALTWSVFGPLAYAGIEHKRNFATALLHSLGLPCSPPENVAIWLWRRLPHPDTLVSGGPEIDFGLQTDDTLLLGEAKWFSGVGQLQGIAKDKDQLTLRKEFCRNYGGQFFGGYQRLVILGVSLTTPMMESEDETLPCGTLHMRSTTWQDLCQLSEHPLSNELQRYLDWKKANSIMPSREKPPVAI